MKLLVEEPESEALVRVLVDDDRQLVASWLLHAELHCAAGRHPDDIDPVAVNTALSAVTLVDLARGDLLAAGTHAPLRTHDAIHLAVALRVEADELIAHDGELCAAGRRAGLVVSSPQ